MRIFLVSLERQGFYYAEFLPRGRNLFAKHGKTLGLSVNQVDRDL